MNTVKNELFGWFHLHGLGNLVIDELLRRENQIEVKFVRLNTLQQDLNNHITINELNEKYNELCNLQLYNVHLDLEQH